jgi:NTP pyrophosphatase (non-canonical NTP hydrolase)
LPVTAWQKIVAEFVDQYGLRIDVIHHLLDLMSEVGELAKAALTTSAYGTQPFRPTMAWAEELGDVLFALLCVANASEVKVEEALKRVIEQYRARLASGGSASSGR